MKISKLHIESFRHLENLDFDFTYPQDFHIEEKRGKPLDKICFIGQSATGKTGLLELIYTSICSFYDLRLISPDKLLDVGKHQNVDIELDFINNFKSYSYKKSHLTIDENKYDFHHGSYNGGGEDVLDNENKLFFFTAGILSQSNLKLFEEETVILIEKYKSIREKFKSNLYSALQFDDNVEDAVWLGLLEDNVNYLQKFLQFASELINTGSILDTTINDKINNWKNENINPLVDFSEKFNNILDKINLEVDLINTKNIAPLKHKITDQNIPIQYASTGTKQLLLTSLLIYKLKTKNSIILIDEPERSLYPDIQMEITEHYQNLAPEAQFVVATHSPFIAASFEPEERFILSFNEEGKVVVKRGTSPIGDDPNDILKNDFGIDYNNQFGKDAYKKYLKLKEDLVNEKNLDKKKDLLLETVKLGDTYNF